MQRAAAWLTCSLADVPAGDAWLSPREQALLDGRSGEKRRAEWRLGRWTAKAAVAAWLGAAAEEVEVLAAADGAPLHDGVSLSLSHRGSRALCVVADAGCRIGCDLEAIAARSPAFVFRWLAPAEREILDAAAPEERDMLACALWSAKEAAVKATGGSVIRTRQLAVELAEGTGGEWRPLSVSAGDGRRQTGWWRPDPRWAMAVVSEPAIAAPRRDHAGR
jgi:4'-phosphopantetheinyl transferase